MSQNADDQTASPLETLQKTNNELRSKIKHYNDLLNEEADKQSMKNNIDKDLYIKKLSNLDFRLTHVSALLSPKNSENAKYNVYQYAKNKHLIEPSVSLLYDRLYENCKDSNLRVQECEDDLEAWKFTPDTNKGKLMMARLRNLLLKNEELGQYHQTNLVSQLEMRNDVHKTCMQELTVINANVESLIEEMSKDLEGLQMSVLALRRELNDAYGVLESVKYELDMDEPGRSKKILDEAMERALQTTP